MFTNIHVLSRMKILNGLLAMHLRGSITMTSRRSMLLVDHKDIVSLAFIIYQKIISAHGILNVIIGMLGNIVVKIFHVKV